MKILFNFYLYYKKIISDYSGSFNKLYDNENEKKKSFDLKNSFTTKKGATIHENENQLKLHQQVIFFFFFLIFFYY